MIGLVTDSASQLPHELATQLGITVVPVTVTVNGQDHREGVDLDPDDFYDLLAAANDGSDATPPTVTTAQPSASAFADAFRTQVEAGASGILAVLVGSAYSGAINSASVAAASIGRIHPDVTIEIVDSETASFGIACAVLAAADALARGSSLDAAKRSAMERAAVTGSVFMIDGTDLARRSGRFGDVDFGTGVPVLASGPDGLSSLGEVQSIDDGVGLMADELIARAPRVVVAIGRSSPATDPVTNELIERVRNDERVVDLIEYRVGPSIAVHTGPHTVGGFSFPA